MPVVKHNIVNLTLRVWTYLVCSPPSQNKAPPHVEGELLKQNIKATFGKKGWRKYFFIVSVQHYTVNELLVSAEMTQLNL